MINVSSIRHPVERYTKYIFNLEGESKNDTFIYIFFLRILYRNCILVITISPQRVIISESSEFYPISFGDLYPEIQSVKKREVKNTVVQFAAFIQF